MAPVERAPRRSDSVAAKGAALVGAIPGSLALAGWIFEVATLTRLWPDAATMKTNTAISSILCALSIWPPVRSPDGCDRRRWLVIPVAILAILTLIEYLAGIDFHIDQPFGPDRWTALNNHPGRMSAASVSDFLLFAGARWFAFDSRRVTDRAFVVLSFLGIAISYHALVGFIYGTPVLHAPKAAIWVSPQTLIAFFALFVGLMELRPDLGWAAVIRMPGAGGVLFRLILPVVLLLLPFVGWLRLKGEMAGHYDTQTGLAMFTSVNILTLSTMLYIAARRMERLDSDRESREADLRRSEERFRAVAEWLPIAMVVLDRSGTIRIINRETERLFGYHRSEVLGNSVEMLVPERLRVDQRALREAWFTKPPTQATEAQRERAALAKDGHEFPVEVRATPIETASGPMLLSLVSDITERKRDTAQAGYLAAIVESSGDAIISKDLNGVITTWNPTAETLFGFTAGGAIGRHISLVIPKARLNEEDEIIARIRRGERVEHFETFRRHKDGREIAVSLTISPIRGPDDKIIGASKIVRDITQRRTIEEQLRQAQKMEAIGQLTGGMAHDFNNLLAIIQGNLELIEGRVLGDPEIEEMTNDALKASARGASLTHHLLAYSRRQSLDPKTVMLDAVMTDVLNLLARTLGETIEIKTVMPADLWQIRIDQNQLENALLNLAVNAKHAMPDGGKLTIEASNAVLDETYAASNAEVAAGPYVRVAVSDTGCGMTKEILDRVLEPFFTTKPVGEGSGLGLSMVYGFIKQSGGHLKIYSEPGHGTTVNLYLRRASGDAGVDTGKDAVTLQAQRGTETILVVEDDEMVRKLALRVLTDFGYQSFAAADGASALAILDGRDQIDLLLTDVVLPKGMSGPELAGQAISRRPGLQVLYMSGYAREAIGRNDILGEGTHLISKPFAKAELTRKIRELLDERRKQ